MVVCKFWLQGNCKFGDTCRNEHPRNVEPRSTGNRFAPLNNHKNYDRNEGNHPRPFAGNSRNHVRQTDNRDRIIDQDLMRNELSNELPIWIFSSYSPRADFPKQLFGGSKRELSPEEVRLRHYDLAAQGRVQEAVQEAETVYQAAKTQTNNVLSDLVGAVKYLQNGFDEHPNRVDICNESTKSGVSPLSANPKSPVMNAPRPSSAFGQPSGSNFTSNSSSVFGQASANSAFLAPPKPPPFGPGASNNTQSTFGQPSTPNNSAFGQTSALGTTSAFGRPSLLGQKQAFGQTSTTQPSTTNNPFAGVSSLPVLGQPSASGNIAPASGQPSEASSSFFGQVNQSTKPAFGPSNPFAQPQSAPNDNALARFPTVDSGMQMDGNHGGLGATSSVATQAPSVFPQQANGFRQSSFGPSTSSSNALGGPSTSTGFGQTSIMNGGFSATSRQLTNGTHSSKVYGTGGKLRSWKGKTVRYVDDQPCSQENDGSWQRIWFPDGPPVWAKPEDLPSDFPYDGELEERYMSAKQEGQFHDGFIPLLPPKREWINWDF